MIHRSNLSPDMFPDSPAAVKTICRTIANHPGLKVRQAMSRVDSRGKSDLKILPSQDLNMLFEALHTGSFNC
jgi:hypothetical protein